MTIPLNRVKFIVPLSRKQDDYKNFHHNMCGMMNGPSKNLFLGCKSAGVHFLIFEIKDC